MKKQFSNGTLSLNFKFKIFLKGRPVLAFLFRKTISLSDFFEYSAFFWIVLHLLTVFIATLYKYNVED